MIWISFFQQKEVLLYGTPVYFLDAQTMLQKTYQISHVLSLDKLGTLEIQRSFQGEFCGAF